jgi:hypothetical protein
MEGQEVKNSEGMVVLPESQYNPIDPQNGVAYVKDDEYEKLKGGAEAGEQANVAEATPEDNKGESGGNSADTTAPQIDYEAILKEKTGGKYERWEDVLAKLDKPEPEVSETTKKFLEALNSGKEDEIADILYQRKILAGVDKMDAESVIKMKIQFENPDWTPEDVADEYDQRYSIGVDRDDVDDSEWTKLERRHKRKLDAEAKSSREFLAGLRDQIKLPEYAAPQAEAEDAGFLQEVERLRKEFEGSLQNTLPSFNKLDLSITDEDVQFKHEYSLEDGEKVDLSNKAKDFWSYFESRYAKDGKYDTQQLLTDIYFNENRSKILKSAVTRAMNLAKAELVKGVANVQESTGPRVPTDLAAEQQQAEFERFLFGR